MQILRSWREQQVMLKRRFSIDGQREKMLSILCAKLGKNREELKLLFAELLTYR